MTKQLVIYMSPWCGHSQDIERALKEWQVSCRAINIREDRQAAARVRSLVGFESTPTLVIAEGDGVDPWEPPAPLPAGTGPRGIDRGSVLTEPTRAQLRIWLVQNDLLTQ